MGAIKTNNTHARRRRRRRRKPVNWNTLAMVATIFTLVVMIVMMGLIIRNDIKHAEFIVDQVEYYDNQLSIYDSKILEIQVSETNLIDELYNVVKEACNNSDDEALKMLWKAEFETDEVFTVSRSKGIITLYAMLDNHPDIKYDVTVAQALYDLDCNRTYLENTVDTYNMMFDHYKFWATDYSRSTLCKFIGGELDETKHLKMVLQ